MACQPGLFDNDAISKGSEYRQDLVFGVRVHDIHVAPATNSTRRPLMMDKAFIQVFRRARTASSPSSNRMGCFGSGRKCLDAPRQGPADSARRDTWLIIAS